MTLRETADRQILYDQHAIEVQFAQLNESARIQRAQMILQAQLDQATEKLRLEYGLKAQRLDHKHALRTQNRELEHEIRMQVSAASRTQDVIAAIGMINRELDAINALRDEDEKHRRFTILHGSLGFMLGGTASR